MNQSDLLQAISARQVVLQEVFTLQLALLIVNNPRLETPLFLELDRVILSSQNHLLKKATEDFRESLRKKMALVKEDFLE